jgi:hypothetical protein
MNEAPSRLRARTEGVANTQSRSDHCDVRTRSRRPLTRLAKGRVLPLVIVSERTTSVSDRTFVNALFGLILTPSLWTKPFRDQALKLIQLMQQAMISDLSPVQLRRFRR